jgi:hypothetical protein
MSPAGGWLGHWRCCMAEMTSAGDIAQVTVVTARNEWPSLPRITSNRDRAGLLVQDREFFTLSTRCAQTADTCPDSSYFQNVFRCNSPEAPEA